MREIKFRGRNIEGEWFYGDLINSKINNTPTAFIFPPDAPNSYDRYLVNPNTVGQFTGLHDKNGKEIYEGDVLFVREWENLALAIFDHDERECLSLEDCKGALLQECQRVVHFEEGSMCAGDYYISTLWDKQDQRHQYPIFEVEIIGNIHDNPETKKFVIMTKR
jgi:uncharacterized phage protein (TIGR01671 family)